MTRAVFVSGAAHLAGWTGQVASFLVGCVTATCQLHFDHCGGNPLLPGRPILTQRAELDLARNAESDTLPELIDAPGLTYAALDGEPRSCSGSASSPRRAISPSWSAAATAR